MAETDIAKVSVVVPTFNRLAQLRRTLEALAQQVDVDVPVEVVVVDDGSTDRTPEWLVSPDVPVQVVSVSQQNGGPAAARNWGIQNATGDLIIFLDDDVVPATDLIATHLGEHAAGDGDLVVIGPMRTPDSRLSPWVRWEQKQLDKQYDAMLNGLWEATPRQFFTGNASVERRHLAVAGGFDTSFRRAEDVELGHRLADAGLKFTFVAEAVVLHYAERPFTSWRAAAGQYGRNDVIFGRELGREDLLRQFCAEFHYRHPLIRLTTSITLRSRVARRALVPVVAAATKLLCRTGPTALTDAALSALYNLEYYHGMADQLGGGRELLRRFEAERPT
ncbi:MAG: glycosyltransferase family 2 protein [Ilumatobacter sp.]|nr:glycosyltransferase family 2 protein [Ilumatobacter sp.]